MMTSRVMTADASTRLAFLSEVLLSAILPTSTTMSLSMKAALIPSHTLDLQEDSNLEAPSSKQAQKRNRPTLSCTNCRHSKLKCDRKQPCLQCIKRGKTSQCALPQQSARRKPAVSMQNRLKHLETLVKDVMGGQSPVSTAEYMLNNSTGESPNSRMTSSSDVFKTVESLDGELATQPSGNVLFRPNEKSTYVGATHWAAILEDVSWFTS